MAIDIVKDTLPGHPRTALRRCAADLLDSAGFTGRVFQNREEPWMQTEFPVCGVYVTEEIPIETDLSPVPDWREATLVVQVLEWGDGLDLDDRLDALSLIVEQAVTFQAMRSLLQDGKGIPLLDLQYGGTSLGVADDGQRQVGCAEVTFRVEYEMPPPETSLDLFVTGHIDWDLADGEGHPDGDLEATDIVTLPQD